MGGKVVTFFHICVHVK